MRQRIRTVKPEFFHHGLLHDLDERLGTGGRLRLTYEALWTCSDREGRFEWKPRELKHACLPYDDVDFDAILETLRANAFIARYVVEGREYGVVLRFHTHQTINPRESESRLPAPTSRNVVDVQERTEGHELGRGLELTQVVELGRGSDLGASTGAGHDTVASTPEAGGGVSADSNGVSAAAASSTDASSTRGARERHMAHGKGREGKGTGSTELPTTSSRLASIDDAPVPEIDGAISDVASDTNGTPGMALTRSAARSLPATSGPRTVQAVTKRLGIIFAEVREGARTKISHEQLLRVKAELVFAYFASKNNLSRTLLDDKREKRIIARLRENDGDVSELLYACDGAHRDKHLSGENDRDTSYADRIETVYRDRGIVERCASYFKAYKRGELHPTAQRYAKLLAGEDVEQPKDITPPPEGAS